jgi:hypothetical protein
VLEIGDLALAGAAFEGRFEKCHLFWDRAGTIWNEITSKRPLLRQQKAEPGNTVFQLGREYALSIVLEQDKDRLNVVAHYPRRNLLDFAELSAEFTEVVARHLQIDSYARLGLRLTYTKVFHDRLAASEAIVATGILRLPERRHFEVSGSPVLPGAELRWEDDKRGCVLRLRAEEVEFSFEPPLGWEGALGPDGPRPYHGKVARFVYDVDVFTTAVVPSSMLNVKDWILNSLHLINRDSNDFLHVPNAS